MKGIRMMDLTPRQRQDRPTSARKVGEISPRLQRDLLIKNGICTQCKAKKATPGFHTCDPCREYHREYKRKQRQREES